jgi:hypothetical protein
LLKQCSPSAGKVEIEYRNGFLNHPKKFDLAKKRLPHECLIIGNEGFEERFEEGV